MKIFKITIFLFVVFVWRVVAAGNNVLVSVHSKTDQPLTVNPESPFWKKAPKVQWTTDINGTSADANLTEVRSRWTNKNLYLLFICHYQSLYLKPDPNSDLETNHLWQWDVAEAFIGDDFQNIKQYKEFEVSPQAEWVDLDIDLQSPKPYPEAWNSEFKVTSRIDKGRRVWFAEMCIPFASFDRNRPSRHQELRINLFRCEGALPNRKLLAWQPTRSKTFHKPEYFGVLRLE
jgi:cellulose/xylan binding protein with CBM9 domain